MALQHTAFRRNKPSRQTLARAEAPALRSDSGLAVLLKGGHDWGVAEDSSGVPCCK